MFRYAFSFAALLGLCQCTDVAEEDPSLVACDASEGTSGRAVVDHDKDGLDTDIAELSFGLQETTPERDADFSRSEPPAAEASETAITLESKFPRPRSQGGQGSCVAWSVAAIATYYASLREGKDPNDIWASPAFIYKRVLDEEKAECDKGTFVSDGLDQLVKEGTGSLTQKPYSDKSCDDGSTVEDPHRYQVGGWVRITPFSRSEVKSTLSLGVPVAIGLQVPVNFRSWHGKGANRVFKSCRSVDGKALGGHAMVIVGYDDTRNAYRIMNSWGTDWGDNGFMWWDYDDFEARKALEAYIVFPTNEAKARTGVDAASLTVDFATAKRITFGDFRGVSLKITANAPIRITEVSFSGPATFSKRYRKYVLDTYLLVEATNVPLGMYDVSLSGTINGASVVRNTKIEVK